MAILMFLLGILLVLVGFGMLAALPWYVAVAILWLGGSALLASGLLRFFRTVDAFDQDDPEYRAALDSTDPRALDND